MRLNLGGTTIFFVLKHFVLGRFLLRLEVKLNLLYASKSYRQSIDKAAQYTSHTKELFFMHNTILRKAMVDFSTLNRSCDKSRLKMQLDIESFSKTLY